MNALFYSHTGRVSGAEIVLLQILDRINKSRFDIRLVCPAEGDLANRAKELGVQHVAVQPVELRFTWNPIRVLRYLVSLVFSAVELRRLIKQQSPEFIHSNSVRAGLVSTFASVALPVRVFWHVQDELQSHPFSTAIRLVVFWFNRVRLIAASKATAQSFEGRLLKKRSARIPSRVIHNSVDLKKFHPDLEARYKLRNELGISKDCFLFGIVGQITPRKGQLEAVQVFNQVRFSGAELLIVGSPMFNQDQMYLESIRETINELFLERRVHLTGPRDDIPNVMRALDALVVNSSSEAFVVVALEAMASGTPVIATDVGGIGEMIEDGKTGILVRYGKPCELKNAMNILIREPDLRESLAKRARQRVADRFSSENFVSAFESFFASEAKRKPARGHVQQKSEVRSNA